MGRKLPQLAMAKVFREGDWRSGYYRDQTFAMAVGVLSVDAFLLSSMQILMWSANPLRQGDRCRAILRLVSLNEDGSWKDLTSD